MTIVLWLIGIWIVITFFDSIGATLTALIVALIYGFAVFRLFDLMEVTSPTLGMLVLLFNIATTGWVFCKVLDKVSEER